MTFEDIEFPVYRKYRTGRNYFKIINARSFEELQLVGETPYLREVQAMQLPERNFIRDIVLNFSEMAFEISAGEYEQLRARAIRRPKG